MSRVLEWACGGCGARNRLREPVCRHCGDAKPDWKRDYDDERP